MNKKPIFSFPQIIYNKQNKKDTFNLNWDSFTKKEEESYNRRIFGSDKDLILNTGVFVPGVSEKWTKYVENIDFTNEEKYIYEIQHFINLAELDWGRKRTFDTCIREMCLGVGIKSIEVAFKLLADLITPHSNHEYYLVLSICLSKFWYKHTGRGLVESMVYIDNLKNYSNVPIVAEYLEDFDEQRDLYDNSYCNLYEDDPIVIKRKRMKIVKERIKKLDKIEQ
jgi:hypothetical protein